MQRTRTAELSRAASSSPADVPWETIEDGSTRDRAEGRSTTTSLRRGIAISVESHCSAEITARLSRGGRNSHVNSREQSTGASERDVEAVLLPARWFVQRIATTRAIRVGQSVPISNSKHPFSAALGSRSARSASPVHAGKPDRGMRATRMSQRAAATPPECDLTERAGVEHFESTISILDLRGCPVGDARKRARNCRNPCDSLNATERLRYSYDESFLAAMIPGNSSSRVIHSISDLFSFFALRVLAT